MAVKLQLKLKKMTLFFSLKNTSFRTGKNNNERISISADIVCIAKILKHHLTPPFENGKNLNNYFIFFFF